MKHFKKVALQKKWCWGWSLMFKNLALVAQARKDIVSSLKNHEGMLPHGLELDEGVDASDAEITRLFFAGFFLNVATRQGSEYCPAGEILLSFY